MTFCSSCGAKNSDSSKFCEKCGSPLVRTQSNAEMGVGKQSSVMHEHKDVDEHHPNGVIDSAVHSVFYESNLRRQVNNLLLLIFSGLLISLGFEYTGFWPNNDEPFDFSAYAITLLLIYGVIYFLVKSAEKKLNPIWIYPLLALYVFAFISFVDADTMEKLQVLKNFNVNRGGMSVYLIDALAIWDLYLGSIVEAIMAFRIVSTINAQKSINN